MLNMCIEVFFWYKSATNLLNFTNAIWALKSYGSDRKLWWTWHTFWTLAQGIIYKIKEMKLLGYCLSFAIFCVKRKCLENAECEVSVVISYHNEKYLILICAMDKCGFFTPRLIYTKILNIIWWTLRRMNHTGTLDAKRRA